MLTDRDRQLIDVLTRRVRVLTGGHIEALFWSDRQAASAARRLVRLTRDGWVIRLRATLHPELSLFAPMWTWTPGDALPPFAQLSTRLRSRWDGTAQETTLYVATPRAAHLMGGVGGLPKRAHQLDHDRHLAALYVRFVRDCPSHAGDWLSEDLIPAAEAGEALPDAVLCDAAGTPYRAIEFGGRYDTRRLQTLHAAFARRSLPYELW